MAKVPLPPVHDSMNVVKVPWDMAFLDPQLYKLYEDNLVIEQGIWPKNPNLYIWTIVTTIGSRANYLVAPWWEEMYDFDNKFYIHTYIIHNRIFLK